MKKSNMIDKAEQERLCDIYTTMREGERAANPRGWAYWRPYYRRQYYFVALADGLVLAIEKPKIETKFCCGEDDRGQGGEGPGTIAWAHKVNESKKTELGFFRANVGEFDKCMIHWVGRDAWDNARTNGRLACSTSCVPAIVADDIDNSYWFDGHSANPHLPHLPSSRHIVRTLTDDDMRRMRHGYMQVRADFIKRVRAYWKRYGASKIQTWTYWENA